MIPALLEGLAQAFLPCSWVILVPALLVAVSTSRHLLLAGFAGSVILFVWTAVAGWLAPPVWVAGGTLLMAAVVWWRLGAGVLQVATVGAGAAWAWQPCVGAELGRALNLAQQDPLAALPGLAAFLLGVVVVGAGIGWLIRMLLERVGRSVPRQLGPMVIGALGLLMVSGLYARVASVLARWSTVIWG
ncbi:MAG: hypothetical protein PVG83_05125 [Acidimicrobiia bacterium]|jgi:hypothetical protein